MRKGAVLALSAFVFTIAWQDAVVVPGVGTLAQLLGLLAVGVAGLALLDRRGPPLRAPSAFLAVMAAFAVWATASLLWSEAPRDAVTKLTTLAQLLVLVWLVAELARGPREQARLAAAYVLGGYVAIGSTLWIFLSRGGEGDWDYRVAAAGANPNWLSIALAVGIPLAWFLFVRRPGSPWQLLYLAYLPLSSTAIVLAASRGGLLTAGAALCVVPFTYPRLDAWRRLALLALVAAAVGAAFAVVPGHPELERNVGRLATTGSEITRGDLGDRTRIWSAGLAVFAERPWTGVGFGGYPAAVEPILGRRHDAHNAFVAVLVETGLVGFAMFVTLFALAVAPLALGADRHAGTVAFLFLALVVGLLPAGWEVHKATWFVLAWIVSRSPLALAVPGRRRSSTPALRGGRA